jgi:hypothetical protein
MKVHYALLLTDYRAYVESSLVETPATHLLNGHFVLQLIICPCSLSFNTLSIIDPSSHRLSIEQLPFEDRIQMSQSKTIQLEARENLRVRTCVQHEAKPHFLAHYVLGDGQNEGHNRTPGT